MKSKLILIMLFTLMFEMLLGQSKITGRVINEESKSPIAYVNIGIVGKNIGTVSNEDGLFTILIETQYMNDSLLFSCVGFEPHSIKISDIQEDNVINLKEKLYFLDEVIVKPIIFEEQRFGISSESRLLGVGFRDNELGYECGLLMRNKKKAEIKSVTVNISSCTYDSIYYRLNIYEAKGRRNFENILTEPIYINVSMEEISGGKLTISLIEKNIIVNGNFLVTLEHVRGLGEGSLLFPASPKQKTYYRKTSQGKWETAPIGMSLSIIADVEK